MTLADIVRAPERAIGRKFHSFGKLVARWPGTTLSISLVCTFGLIGCIAKLAENTEVRTAPPCPPPSPLHPHVAVGRGYAICIIAPAIHVLACSSGCAMQGRLSKKPSIHSYLLLLILLYSSYPFLLIWLSLRRAIPWPCTHLPIAEALQITHRLRVSVTVRE